MLVRKKIELKKNVYFIELDLKYKIEDGSTILCFKDWKNPYYDGGDLDVLINKIEDNYSIKKRNEYDMEISMMGDVLFIYDKMPFISGIKVIYKDSDNLTYSSDYLTKKDIEDYIKLKKIKLSPHNDFDLTDEDTWNI